MGVLFFSVALILVLSLLTNFWVPWRMGVVCLPFLMVSSIGLDSAGAFLARLRKKESSRLAFVLLAGALFAVPAIAPNRAYLQQSMGETKYYCASRALAKWPSPLRCVLATGDHPSELESLHLLYLLRAEDRPTREVCAMRFQFNPSDREIASCYARYPKETAFITITDENTVSPPFPGLRIESASPREYAIFRLENPALGYTP